MILSILTEDSTEQKQLVHNTEVWSLLSSIDSRIRSFIKYDEASDPVDLLMDIRADVLELLSKVEP